MTCAEFSLLEMLVWGCRVGTGQCGFSAASPGMFMGWDQRSEEPEAGARVEKHSGPAGPPLSCQAPHLPHPSTDAASQVRAPALAQVSSLSTQHLPRPRVSPISGFQK